LVILEASSASDCCLQAGTTFQAGTTRVTLFSSTPFLTVRVKKAHTNPAAAMRAPTQKAI
jgi:hypothetical protein